MAPSWTEAEVAAALRRMGTKQPAPQAKAPQHPSLHATYPEEPFYQVLQTVGHQHGWQGLSSWMPDDPDQGLCCWLLRPPELLYVQVTRPGQDLTPIQQRWIRALRQTMVEVLEWSIDDVDSITKRLSQSPKTR
jgi:hypothetical protein